MSGRIEFFDKISETTIPIIRLTKSRNKVTGTATFIFIRPLFFSFAENYSFPVEQMSLIWENKKISTTDITILFNKGQPFLIKSIFVFKNSKDWFEFLNFMKHYSNEVGLSFTKP